MKKLFKRILLESLILALCLSTVSCGRDDEPINTYDPKADNVSTEIPEAGNTTAENSSALTEQTTAETPILSENEIKEIIDHNLDILMQDSDDLYSEQQIVDAHPEAFENIISLGEAALPYLNEIIENHPHTHLMHQENICGVIAKFAAYAIKPSLYDQIFISPDENYILKAQVGTFFGTEWGGGRILEYDRLSIIDNLTGNLIAETTATASDRYYGLYTNLEVNWSPDSQYVAIQSSDLHSYTSTDLFDIRRAEFITLPSADEIKQMISNQESFIGTEFVVSEWGESNVIKIDLFLRNGIACVITGNYTYDLNSKKILDINYHLEN